MLQVTIPAYNAEETIAAAVESCLNPGVNAVVVVDDKSTDSTPDVIRKLAGKDSRVRGIVLSRNVGQYAACNTAFAHSAPPGVVDYYMMLDSDDINAPERVVKTLDAFAADPDLMIVSGQMESIDQDGNKKGGSYKNLPEDPATVLQRQSRHVLINGVMTFRRRVLDVLGGYEAASGGADTEFIYRAYYACLKMRNLKDVLGYRRVHSGQCTSATQTDPERAAYRTKIAGAWTWWRALKLRGRLQQEHLRINPVTAPIAEFIGTTGSR